MFPSATSSQYPRRETMSTENNAGGFVNFNVSPGGKGQGSDFFGSGSAFPDRPQVNEQQSDMTLPGRIKIGIHPLPQNMHEKMQPGTPIFLLNSEKFVNDIGYKAIPIYQVNQALEEVARFRFYDRTKRGVKRTREDNNDATAVQDLPLSNGAYPSEYNTFFENLGTDIESVYKAVRPFGVVGSRIPHGRNHNIYGTNPSWNSFGGNGTDRMELGADLQGQVDTANLWGSVTDKDELGFAVVMCTNMYRAFYGVDGNIIHPEPTPVSFPQIVPVIGRNGKGIRFATVSYTTSPGIKNQPRSLWHNSIHQFAFEERPALVYETDTQTGKRFTRLATETDRREGKFIWTDMSGPATILPTTRVENGRNVVRNDFYCDAGFDIPCYWRFGEVVKSSVHATDEESIKGAIRSFTMYDLLKSSSILKVVLHPTDWLPRWK